MKPNRKEEACNDLKRRVLTLELPPSHVLDEVALSDLYQLSRTPLREVLQRLAGEGYLSLTANRGASVSSMDLATMRNFFQSAPLIYAAIARLATEHATAAQIVTLKKIQHRFAKSLDKRATADMSMLNHAFHEQLGLMADSPYLSPSLGRLLIDHTRMSHRFYSVHAVAASQKVPNKKDKGDAPSNHRVVEASAQHEAMIMAIENRQPALSVELAIAHWELSRSQMDQYVMPDALPMDGIDALAGQQ